MSLLKNRMLLFIFLLGFLLRISLLFLDFSFDVNNHIIWSHDASTYGLSGFYDRPSTEIYAYTYPNYPPLSILMFYPFHLINSLFYKFFWFLNTNFALFPSGIMFFIEKRAFLAGLLKIPSVLSDIGIGLMMYLFIKRIYPNNKKLHIIGPLLILFNPVFFYNSSFWGQIDGIPILFVLLSLYYLLFSKKIIISTLFFTFALLFKPTAFLFLPIYVFLLLKTFGLRKCIIPIFINIFTFWLFFIPFFKEGNVIFYPFATYLHNIVNAQSTTAVSNAAYTAWAMYPKLMYIQDSSIIFLGLSYRTIGYFFTGVMYLLFICKLNRTKKISPSNCLFIIGLASYGALLFMTRINERYFIIPLAFIIPYALKNKYTLRLWIAMSLIAFINLYKSFAVPDIGIVDFLNLPSIIFFFSVLNVMIFLFLTPGVRMSSDSGKE